MSLKIQFSHLPKGEINQNACFLHVISIQKGFCKAKSKIRANISPFSCFWEESINLGCRHPFSHSTVTPICDHNVLSTPHPQVFKPLISWGANLLGMRQQNISFTLAKIWLGRKFGGKAKKKIRFPQFSQGKMMINPGNCAQ